MFDYAELDNLTIKELRNIMSACREHIDQKGQKAAKSLMLGSKVSYFSSKKGKRVTGTLAKKKRKRAEVVEDDTYTVWDVPFSMLEPEPEPDEMPQNILHFPR